MESFGKNPYMDYRNRVPFMDLSGFVLSQPNELETKPAASLKEELFKKRFTKMINLRRMKYRVMCEVYRNGRA